MYIHLLERHLLNQDKNVRGPSYIFLQKQCINSLKKTQMEFEDNKSPILDWPANSLNLNITENDCALQAQYLEKTWTSGSV